jgi:hypothetical protein
MCSVTKLLHSHLLQLTALCEGDGRDTVSPMQLHLRLALHGLRCSSECSCHSDLFQFVATAVLAALVYTGLTALQPGGLPRRRTPATVKLSAPCFSPFIGMCNYCFLLILRD